MNAKLTEHEFSALLLEVLLSVLEIDGGRASMSLVVDQRSSLSISESVEEDRLLRKDIIRASIAFLLSKELVAILTGRSSLRCTGTIEYRNG